MTSTVAHNNPHQLNANANSITSGTTSPLSGAVPAQLPVRSYANATKTASPAPPPPAGASAQNAKSTESSVNGASPTAHGGSQPNGTSAHADHARKPSVVINASGASGYTPNGGPVSATTRPAISFGQMNGPGTSPLPQQSVPYQSQTASLPAPQRDPRATSPAHSPSPIPQPPASGGRPPSGLQNQGNGMTFGQLGGESDQSRHGHMPSAPLGPGMPGMHERRASSQSMQSDMGNPSMNRNFAPQAGRGRGFPQQQYPQMSSPAQSYRSIPGQQGSRPPMPQSFQQPPSSPFGRGRTGSPAMSQAQPHMYGGGYQPYPQQMHPGYNFDSGTYYPPYNPYNQYNGQPPPSPRPYPSPYNTSQGPHPVPFHPQHSENMSRTPSQSSQRPPSSLGQSQTPSQPPSSQTPVPSQQQPPQQSTNFVRPPKKTNAIKITDAQGNPLNFNKSSPAPGTPAPVQSQGPLIVSTPNAPTPPPRVPSAQHVRTESKPAKSAEETKNAFQEQVKRQMEEEKRRKEEEAAAKTKVEDDAAAKLKAEENAAAKAKADEEAASKAKADQDAADAKRAEDDAAAAAKAKEQQEAEEAARNQIKEATAAAEKAAAVAASDKAAAEAAEAAEKAAQKPDAEKDEKEETEDERLEREIAEMEAADAAEAEREKAFNEKRQLEKAEQAKRQAEKDANADEELKRQEREAEAREEARERERQGGNEKDQEKDDDGDADEESKALFASLKKPTLGPGAAAPESGSETPVSEDAPSDSASMPPPPSVAGSARAGGAQKPKPAHLKLETSKRVEAPEPTPGMQALKSARFLEVKEELSYPDGFKSPNPALNASGTRKGRAYDKDFLLQFQSVFNEKPSTDWDQKVKETLGPGDEPGSARASTSARTPSTRQPSGRPGVQPSFGGPMGNFGGQQPMRTLPPNTTSEQRFQASQAGGRGGLPGIPGQIARMPSNLGMGTSGVGMVRNNSLQTMGGMGGPNSPRQPSSRGGRGGNSSRRGDRNMSKREEADLANKMPLTAHMELAPLEKSQSGWKPTSIGAPAMAGPDPSGHMAPDMVQRKVKAALNKMTPEKFDKISDQILEIASQSKTESDGRTLRQIIQLTFEKACDEAHWAGMYAQFCHKMLTTMSTDIRDETIKDKGGNPVVGGALFRKYLLNRCQEEFERGWQANLPEKPEGDSQEAALLSDDYYIAAAAKRRGLGLIQFIGQLYKLRMLTLRIMHECVMRLLNFEGDPDESAVENLTTLLKAVGATMEDDESGRGLMTTYFQRIDAVLLKSEKLPSRSRFMIMDLVDLRKAHWRGKDDSKGPKTLDQVHQEAAAAQAKAEAERARQGQRGGGPPGGNRMPAGRGDARNFSGNMPAPVDYQSSTVGMQDLRRLQNRNTSQRQTGGSLAPGGALGPGGGLGARSGSRRGLGPPSSGNTTRTNTPPVDKDKKDEPSTQSNAFSALAALDPSGEGEEAASQSEAISPPAARNRSKSPLAGDHADETS